MAWRSWSVPSLAIVVAATGAAPLGGQTPEEPCSGPEHRQFDFWIGEWEVRNFTTGRLAGTNEITVILGGCVLLESYSTPVGYAGRSYNVYDRTTGMWHQTWVDNSGVVLKLDGGIEGGRMVLRGDGVNRQGEPIRHRISWTPNEDGTVRQTWETSGDGGESWTTVFDGLYRERGSDAPEPRR